MLTVPDAPRAPELLSIYRSTLSPAWILVDTDLDRIVSLPTPVYDLRALRLAPLDPWLSRYRQLASHVGSPSDALIFVPRMMRIAGMVVRGPSSADAAHPTAARVWLERARTAWQKVRHP